MRILIDTNILLRAVQPRHPAARTAINAIKKLHRQQHLLCLAPQNIVEFWSVCTRPVDVNGLGLSITGTERHVRRLKHIFPIVSDSLQTFHVWHELVLQHGIAGTKVHDARLVGVMRVHGISGILTFNVRDFARYDNITVIQPDQVI